MTKEEISKLIYYELNNAYCSNCRYQKENDLSICEECHRKYIGWAVSEEKCDLIAEKIKDGDSDAVD